MKSTRGGNISRIIKTTVLNGLASPEFYHEEDIPTQEKRSIYRVREAF